MKPWLGDGEVAAAEDTIRSGWVAQGPRVAEFEKALAGQVGAAHGVAVSSCTTGLHLALHALGIGPGDEVVVPSLSFIATANAPRYVGATPVFADVDPVTQNLTADTIEAVITPATRAVIVVHQVGMPAELDEIAALCHERNLTVIEDAACAIGSTYRGAAIGSHSDVVVFSFHPRKILTTGEGGMITTSSEDLAARMRRLRQHGMSMSAFDRHENARVAIEEYVEMGYNFRMTDLQAAVGIVQLEKLTTMIERRRELAEEYRRRMEGIDGLQLPADPSYGTTNFQSYAVVLREGFPASRNHLMEMMLERAISTRRGVMAAHREPAFAGHPHADLPVTEILTDTSIILPMYHEMSSSDLDRVVRCMADAAGA
jgi:dTDP-4-amino-4,6-dideoxygalactose transaminase